MTVKSSTTINGTEITVKNFDSESLETVTSELEITSERNEKKSSSKIWRKFAGIVLTIIASFFFSIGSVIVKSISEISVADMTTYRFGSKSILYSCALSILKKVVKFCSPHTNNTNTGD